MAKDADLAHGWKPLFMIYTLLLPYVSSTCYFDSGTIATTHIPCNVSAVGTTQCCQHGAACLTTGLCMLSYDSSFNTGSCTDKSWNSQQCFRMCPGNRGALNTLYRCDENLWCCSSGGNITSCCQDPNVELFKPNSVNGPSLVMGGEAWAPEYTIAPVAALNAVGTSKNPTSGPSQLPSPLPDASSTSNNTAVNPKSSPSEPPSPSPDASSTSNNAAMKAGLGAGLGAGLSLVTALSIMLFFLRRERHINRKLRQSQEASSLKEQKFIRESKGQDFPRELDSDPVPPELSSANVKFQLPA
ncbi:MAG: hypothetical protein Q9213_007788 [Squamulea squamosa]